METGRITAFVLVALISAVVTYFVVHSLTGEEAGVCDVHPHLSSTDLRMTKANVDRARRIAHDAAIGDKQDGDAANRAGEDAAFDSFVFSLRGPLEAEYKRHRQALDGCY
jgi:hypothetical protein